MKKPLIVALDFSRKEEVTDFLNQFEQPENLTVKVGMELFYRFGPKIVEQVRSYGCQVFLDLKLFDIPNTVEKAMENIAGLGVDFVTVHTLGGSKMLAAAKSGLVNGAAASGMPVPKLLGVTELTSVSPLMLKDEQHCNLDMTTQVVSLAKLAKRNGCDGVVSSALELKMLTRELPKDFLYVVPGIRSQSDVTNDQQRVATPRQARKWGATSIVVGRPITKAVDAKVAYTKYKREWEQ